jgi:hypothetical protein
MVPARDIHKRAIAVDVAESTLEHLRRTAIDIKVERIQLENCSGLCACRSKRHQQIYSTLPADPGIIILPKFVCF